MKKPFSFWLLEAYLLVSVGAYLYLLPKAIANGEAAIGAAGARPIHLAELFLLLLLNAFCLVGVWRLNPRVLRLTAYFMIGFPLVGILYEAVFQSDSFAQWWWLSVSARAPYILLFYIARFGKLPCYFAQVAAERRAAR